MSTIYAPRAPYPRWLQRALAQTITLEVYRDGALAAPVSGAFSLFDPTGLAVVASRAIAVASSRAQVGILSGDLPATCTLGEDWREEWALLMPDGVTHTFPRPAAVVRTRLYPVVSDADLLARYPDLGRLRPSSLASWQSYLDEAWTLILGRLYGLGNWPYLILDPWTLREPHLDLTLHLVFTAMHTGSAGTGESRWTDLGRQHRLNFEHQWKRLRFRYDADQDGHVTEGDRRAAAGAFFTNVPPRTSWGW